MDLAWQEERCPDFLQPLQVSVDLSVYYVH